MNMRGNARFALTVEPGNSELRTRARRIDEIRAKNIPTVPGTMAEERVTNPCLRADDPALPQLADTVGDPVATFAEICHRKDISDGKVS
jgi:hydroxyacylglutathione hydrolase